MPTACPFCNMSPERIHLSTEKACAIRDGFPVTELHSLVIPKRHVADYFSLTTDELLAIGDLLNQLRREILAKDHTVEGFNIGVNVGTVAGQTIFHCHIHLIPRRIGDVENPVVECGTSFREREITRHEHGVYGV